MNGLKISTPEEFLQLYTDNPPLAMTLLYENISGIKNNCLLTQAGCKHLQKKNLVRNTTVQAGGGFMGGAAAVWAYIKLFASP